MMKKEKKVCEGICNLTKHQGRFIKSHIIPSALTEPYIKNNYFLQFGPKQRRKRRWSSWYDLELVTAKGEQYLTDLDTWAIEELRKYKLVWSGWEGEKELNKDLYNSVGYGGVRVVEGIDRNKLRLFFLSILWRAAATKLKEFSYVTLPDEDLEHLRLMIINGNPEPQSFYPIQLTQLVTKGFLHNHAGVKMNIRVKNNEDDKKGTILLPIYRMYFDGLIVYFHLGLPDSNNVEKLKGVIVGTADSLVVTTAQFENSLQFNSMLESIVICGK